MKIKHSKYRNTGLIFELLVKQIAADTLGNQDSPAIGILKKYYGSNTSLAKEYKLYEFLVKNSSVSQNKAEALKFLPKLNSELMKIAKTGIIKKQNASRNVSRITKKIAAI